MKDNLQQTPRSGDLWITGTGKVYLIIAPFERSEFWHVMDCASGTVTISTEAIIMTSLRTATAAYPCSQLISFND